VKVKALRDTLRSLPSADVRQLDELLEKVDEADLSNLIAAISSPISKLAATVSKKKGQRRIRKRR
jgi:hypothetical protein